MMWLLTYFLQGYITTKDLAKLTKKLSREEVGALMTKLDTDGDGQLSFDEFKEMLPTRKNNKNTSENRIGPFKNSSALDYVTRITLDFPQNLDLHFDFSKIKHFGFSFEYQ